MQPFRFPPPQVKTSGLVTLTDWMFMPDGQSYKAVWAERWEIVPDNAMPVDGFRSSEHWQLAAVVENDVLLLVPGCKVGAWAYCPAAPDTCSQCWVVK